MAQENVFTDEGDGSIKIVLTIEGDVIKITEFEQQYSINKNANYRFERLYFLLNKLLEKKSIRLEQRVGIPPNINTDITKVVPKLTTGITVKELLDDEDGVLKDYKQPNAPPAASSKSVFPTFSSMFTRRKGGSKKYKSRKVYKSKSRRVRRQACRQAYRKSYRQAYRK